MTLPNPGSDEALEMGCTCVVLDNNHGRGVVRYGGEVMFVYNMDCPLHGRNCNCLDKIDKKLAEKGLEVCKVWVVTDAIIDYVPEIRLKLTENRKWKILEIWYTNKEES